MNDFAFVGIILAFFAVASMFVAGCDRIIGSDEDAFVSASSDPVPAPGERSGTAA